MTAPAEGNRRSRRAAAQEDDVPDVGMVSITDIGNGENTAYAGASTEQGQQLLDEWTTGQCG